ncbi:hypothetical protein CH330_07375 [candidate division WOR-3 bacterium JGI_Cruoil_03_51_56]|uniref:DUF2723 domain-containing protein n=1 Tax=candidate division WOR-3 bacterium JGI_Cruoil_03_51_56 TaxID=1973747 RepID=A0A235BRM3_UNCW3|nr:MAG: hypothetical protein CH330_07375 [candidate division WOR-3 bacterium JGI_Cruoil_03_51_56]
MTEESNKTDAFIASGMGLLVLSGYLICLCHLIGPGDSAELTLAALKLGIAHPPGYPLFTWLGRIATFIPLSEPAFATNLLTALIGAAAISFLYLAARISPISRIGSIVTSLCFGFSATFWQNATSHEVYTLTMLFLALLIFFCIQSGSGRPKMAIAAAFVLGLATSHQPTALFWLPGLALLSFSRQRKPGLNLILPCILLFLLGFSASLGTLIRATARPEINWGNPVNLSGFFRHITGAQYNSLSFGVSKATARTHLFGFPLLCVSELGIPSVLLSLTGIATLFRRNRSSLIGFLLILATALFGICYNVPDYKPHLLASFMAVAFLAGAGTDFIINKSRKYWKLTALFLIILGPGFTILNNLRLNLENRTTIVHDLGINLLASLPAHAAFIYGSDVTGNAVQFLQANENTKPDVFLISAEMLFSSTYWKTLRQKIPLPDFETALLRAGNRPKEQRKQRLVSVLAEHLIILRPVYLGTGLLTPEFFQGPLVEKFQLVPLGIVNWLLPKQETTIPKDTILHKNQEVWNSYKLKSLRRTYRLPEFQNIQLIYASSRNNLGMFCLEQGWHKEALKNLNASLSIPAPEQFKAVVRQNRQRAISH